MSEIARTGEEPVDEGRTSSAEPRNTDEGARFSSLMKAAQDGETSSYVELLDLITPRLRNIVRRRRSFMSPEDIEDLVQDILLSVHSVRATYDPERPFIPWLLAITRNRLADGARRYARKEGKEVIVEDMEVTFAAPAANTDIDAENDRMALHQAIGDLPDGQRSAIEMLKLKEMSLKEASAASGMSIGALKVATHRAVASLRKIMAKEK